MKISVIVPVFNEKATIGEILNRIRATNLDIELIVVDDGSTDGTRDALKQLAGRIDHLLLQPIEKAGADLVLGSRLTGAKPQRAYYYWHYVGNRLITFIARVLYNTTLSDIYTCYKVFRREQLTGLDVQSDGFEFDAEFLAILLKRHLVVYEVPISYYGRSYGEGKKIKWYHTAFVIWNLVKYRFV